MSDAPVLQNAIQLFKAGHKAEATQTLKQIILNDPQNEAAWLWLSACLDNPNYKCLCFQRALKINPDNAQAKEAMEQLTAWQAVFQAPPQNRTDREIQARTNSANPAPLSPYPPPNMPPFPPASAAIVRREHVCPLCGRSDRIAKVTSILSIGTSLAVLQNPGAGNPFAADSIPVAVEIGGSSLVSEPATRLAERLAPPAEPEKPSSSTPYLLIFIGSSALVGSIILASTKNPTIFGPLGIISILLGVVWGFLNWKEKENYRSAYASWQDQKKKWNRLYYCARDEIVFDPRSGNSAVLENLGEFL
jgi:hypothetical protein